MQTSARLERKTPAAFQTTGAFLLYRKSAKPAMVATVFLSRADDVSVTNQASSSPGREPEGPLRAFALKLWAANIALGRELDPRYSCSLTGDWGRCEGY